MAEAITLDSQWLQLLSITTANELAKQKDRKVIVLSSDVTVKEALDVLSQHNIISAPVSDSGKFLGFVDVLDICGHALNMWRKKNKKGFSLHLKKFSAMDSFFNTTVKDIVNFSGWNFSVQLNAKDTALTVATVLNSTPIAKRDFKPHRLCVLNENHQFINIISQTDLITFALAHIKTLPSLASRTVSELNLARLCLMVRIDSPFVDTLELLYTNKFGGIALVDEQGKLAANFSASDLRGIQPDAFNLFNGSVLQYLCKGSSSTLRSPVVCTPTTTLEGVLNILISNKIHRVYVVDETERATGIISLSDIIALLAPDSE